MTLHPRKESIQGVTRGVIEVSETIYGTEMTNREKISFDLRTNTNSMKLEDNRSRIS